MDLQNFDESTRWFRKAAERGFPDAQLMLGSAYDYGKGVKKDSVEAVRWYRLARICSPLLSHIRLAKNRTSTYTPVRIC
jgi:TPR repeat protein